MIYYKNNKKKAQKIIFKLNNSIYNLQDLKDIKQFLRI